MSNNKSQSLQPAEVQAITFEMARSRYEYLQAIVAALLVEGEDYGTLPGVPEPYLKKSGAEKLRSHFNLRPHPELVAYHEDWEKGIFNYRYRSTLYSADGQIVAAAERACNTMEDKFRFRWVDSLAKPSSKEEEAQLKASKKGRWKKVDNEWTWQVREEHTNPYDNVNNAVARAQKRANVAATVEAFAASGFFAKEGAKAKAKKDMETKDTHDGPSLFWSRVRQNKIADEIAKPLAAQANAGELTWEEAFNKLPK